jgi:hypothetical protein
MPLRWVLHSSSLSSHHHIITSCRCVWVVLRFASASEQLGQWFAFGRSLLSVLHELERVCLSILASVAALLIDHESLPRTVNREGQSKRWYKNVEIERIDNNQATANQSSSSSSSSAIDEVASVPSSSGCKYVFRLDGRVVVTPNETPLSAPTLPLAQAVAVEWLSQQQYIQPFSMPLVC